MAAQEQITDLTFQGNFNKDAYNSRIVSSVYLPTGEPYIFYVTQAPDSSSFVYKMKRPSRGSMKLMLESDGEEDDVIPAGVRIIAGQHVKTKKPSKANGEGNPDEPGKEDTSHLRKTRWVGFKDKDSKEVPVKIWPFLEVYSISVVYNSKINRLDLFFWANIKFNAEDAEDNAEDAEDAEYNLDNLVFQRGANDFCLFNKESISPDRIKKQLYHSTGTFVKASIDAEVVTSRKIKDSVDYIPIFEFPQPLDLFKKRDSVISDLSGGSGDVWKLSISGSTATCTNCIAMITGITLFSNKKEGSSGHKPSDFESLSVSLSGIGGWICGTYNGETKKLGLIHGLPLYATAQEFQENEETIVFPLYYVEKEKNRDSWFVSLDARTMPRVGAYW